MSTTKLEELLNHFYEISGMDIAIINRNNVIIARRYSGAQFCACIQKSQTCMQLCAESDRRNRDTARERGGLHVYQCPFGLHEALMPIYKNEEIVAYVFVGLGIEDSPKSDKGLLRRALDAAPTLDKNQLEASIRDLPRFSKKKLDAFSSLLPPIAKYIEVNNLFADTEMTVGQLVKSYVKNNLSKKITLSDIAKTLHCSTVTLTMHFKAEYGMTIMEYVMKKRMDKAKQLLLNSELSIREIAEECGFADNEYFCRCFKKALGSAPTVWRRDNRGTQKGSTSTPSQTKKSVKNTDPLLLRCCPCFE